MRECARGENRSPRPVNRDQASPTARWMVAHLCSNDDVSTPALHEAVLPACEQARRKPRAHHRGDEEHATAGEQHTGLRCGTPRARQRLQVPMEPAQAEHGQCGHPHRDYAGFRQAGLRGQHQRPRRPLADVSGGSVFADFPSRAALLAKRVERLRKEAEARLTAALDSAVPADGVPTPQRVATAARASCHAGHRAHPRDTAVAMYHPLRCPTC